jgi:hypothetical protein
LGATIIGEEERAMIRQRGGERMEDVSVEAYIPFQVAKECVKLAKGGIVTFIGPSELSILEVDFIKLTSVELHPKTLIRLRLTLRLFLSLTFRICLKLPSTSQHTFCGGL